MFRMCFTHPFKGRRGCEEVLSGASRGVGPRKEHEIMRRTLLLSSLYMFALTLLALPYEVAV